TANLIGGPTLIFQNLADLRDNRDMNEEKMRRSATIGSSSRGGRKPGSTWS
uniref:Uncharacterized protein n=1 Tax=Triticum urartu TaxID=4572 RepID=A0A8R7UQX5_TRIUA